jgi:hypothetical protein
MVITRRPETSGAFRISTAVLGRGISRRRETASARGREVRV